MGSSPIERAIFKVGEKVKIKEQLEKVRESLVGYDHITLVAATKYMDLEQTKVLVEAGITHLGENRTDMFLEKYEALKDYPNIKWHFFGNLQSRKVRDVANRIHYLHSLDRTSLAAELNKRLENPLDCFVQVNLTNDEKKSGVRPNKLISFIKSLKQYPKIRVIGLMCIAPFTFDQQVLEDSFKKMQELQKDVQELHLECAPCTELSMGMSNDYKIALKYGATFIRLGRVFLK